MGQLQNCGCVSMTRRYQFTASASAPSPCLASLLQSPSKGRRTGVAGAEPQCLADVCRLSPAPRPIKYLAATNEPVSGRQISIKR